MSLEHAPDTVERNKDKLDLKPNIDFVSRNIDRYEAALEALLTHPPTQEGERVAARTEFTGYDGIVGPQVDPELARELLSRMPASLAAISRLTRVSYDIGPDRRSHKNQIPVPRFNEQTGQFIGLKAFVHVDDFPRPEDHPSRILVGVSNGTTIFPTPIPPSVSEDERAVLLYQVHVFLHEFFHTCELLIRDPRKRKTIKLVADGEHFTFQDWWHAFSRAVRSPREPECISSYAATYENELQSTHPTPLFVRALGEQVAEAFVAHQLNIISNDSGWTDFRVHDFGNAERRQLFEAGRALSANLKWELMDRLCRAKLVS